MSITPPRRSVIDWKWINSSRCTEVEIAFAQAEGENRWYVNDDGIGFVLVSPDDPRLRELSE